MRHYILRTLVIAAFATVPALAAATAWQGVNRDIDKLIVYVDADSIKHEGSVRRARVLFDYLEPQQRPASFEQFGSLERRLKVDCSDRSYEREEDVMYSGRHATGKVLDQQDYKAAGRTFDKEIPFTNSQAIVDYVCSA